ncbi:enterotoxin A family protein [Paraburkholderia phosphatilytica]|uniref:enterotoxin A family protein n=1 Tax=Paraburkholderia phosphatilytica TaxID=2282883 RepID=UPI0013DEA3EE|nr:enterotoxin A family protein [Paraburkholderia phosphatilytica]
MDGGVTGTTTTWCANTARWTAHGLATVTANDRIELSRAENTPLGDVLRTIQGHANRSFVPVRAALPTEPSSEAPPVLSIREYLKKRSTDDTGTSNPRILYRPSAITPAELEQRGGFSTEQALLRDVNLSTHNFDVANHKGLADSAGFLVTFAAPAAAIDRMKYPPQGDRYLYLAAPSPNMVDVNGSLGLFASGRDNHEFAAMGRIEYTQIYDW